MHRRARGGTTRVQERGRTPCQRTRLMVEAGLGESESKRGDSVGCSLRSWSEAGNIRDKQRKHPQCLEGGSTTLSYVGCYTSSSLLYWPRFSTLPVCQVSACSVRVRLRSSEFGDCVRPLNDARLILTTPVVADKTPHTPSCCLGQPDRLAGTSRGDSRVRIILSRARRRGRLRTMAPN